MLIPHDSASVAQECRLSILAWHFYRAKGSRIAKMWRRFCGRIATMFSYKGEIRKVIYDEDHRIDKQRHQDGEDPTKHVSGCRGSLKGYPVRNHGCIQKGLCEPEMEVCP